MHPDLIASASKELNLRQNLVGKAGGHDETRVPGGATQVHQSPFGQQDEPFAVRKDDVIDLGLDFLPVTVFKAGYVDLHIKMTDVAQDGLILHAGHMLISNDPLVAGGGYEYVRLPAGLFHGHYRVSLHCRLQGADGIDFGDPHARAPAP